MGSLKRVDTQSEGRRRCPELFKKVLISFFRFFYLRLCVDAGVAFRCVAFALYVGFMCAYDSVVAVPPSPRGRRGLLNFILSSKLPPSLVCVMHKYISCSLHSYTQRT